MARKLSSFPEPPDGRPRRYPWPEWTDGDVWEIRQGEDYDVATENMRVNLHVKADSLGRKVKTRKSADGAGLVFQFLPSPEQEILTTMLEEDPERAAVALRQLHEDALEIYERARAEVTIERSDGRRQRYAAVRFKMQIEAAAEGGNLPEAVARIVRKPTLGYGHLTRAGRKDLLLETLVVNPERPYHYLFSPKTVKSAAQRLEELDEQRRRP